MTGGVSILLLVKNERASLERSWPFLAAQDYGGPVEFMCIDSGSTDGTVEFLRERGVAVHAINPASFHHGRTRNLAASMARNDILVFLSGDAVPVDTTWLRRLVEPFDDPRVGGAFGRQLPGDHIGPIRRFTMSREYPDEPEVRDLSGGGPAHLGMFRMSNANSAVRRDVWERFPFNETVVMSEDVGMCRDILEAGMKVAYVPGAAVVHCHDKSLWYEFQKAFDSGASLRRMNILGNPAYGSETGYGLRLVTAMWRHFSGRGAYGTALLGLAHCAARWTGVKMGKRADSLPHWLTRRISAGVEKMREA